MEEIGSNPLFIPIPPDDVGVAGFNGLFSGPLVFGEIPPLGPIDPGGPGYLGPGPGPPDPDPPPICGLGTGNLWSAPGVRGPPGLGAGYLFGSEGVPGPMLLGGPTVLPLPPEGLGTGKLFMLSLTLEGVCGVFRPPAPAVYLGGMLPSAPLLIGAEEGVPGPPSGVPGPPLQSLLGG